MPAPKSSARKGIRLPIAFPGEHYEKSRDVERGRQVPAYQLDGRHAGDEVKVGSDDSESVQGSKYHVCVGDDRTDDDEHPRRIPRPGPEHNGQEGRDRSEDELAE
jgi:hypothetical protein